MEQQGVPRVSRFSEVLRYAGEIRAALPAKMVFPLGYSLAGLAAIASYYESEGFSGFASCSGALWVDGFEEAVTAYPAHPGGIAYLSLGGREEKSPNPKLARVGEQTRWFYGRLKKDTSIRACTLEMVRGGHFGNADQRLAGAVNWLLANLQ